MISEIRLSLDMAKQTGRTDESRGWDSRFEIELFAQDDIFMAVAKAGANRGEIRAYGTTEEEAFRTVSSVLLRAVADRLETGWQGFNSSYWRRTECE